MSSRIKITALAAAATMAATPTAALAHNHPHPGHPTQAKSYGFYCRTESKRHVAGEHGTPFSRCVTALAKAADGASARKACKTESKRHVAGRKGTPFSRCVVAAAQMKADAASG
jgi:hypothetical protein